MDVAATEPPPRPAVSPPRPSTWGLMSVCLGVATDPRKLVLAAMGLLALWAGWSAIGVLFGGRPVFWSPTLRPTTVNEALNPVPSRLLADLAGRVAEPPRTLMAPFVAFFDTGTTAIGFTHALLAAIWGVAVWGLFGGAIARIAVVQLALGERVGALTALRFAWTNAGSLISAPVSPLLGVGLLAIPCALMGFLLYQIPGPIGATVAGALAFVPLLIGLPLALLVLGLAAGWPLMIATVAAESEDSFDALSRSYAYTCQRPAPYAWTLGIGWVLGIIGLLAVSLFAHLVTHLAEWSLAFGAPDARLHRLFTTTANPGDTPTALHALWLGVVALLVRSWCHAFFWTAIAQIYLLLRRDVDGTPRHEIYQPEHDADTFAPDLPAPAEPVMAVLADTPP